MMSRADAQRVGIVFGEIFAEAGRHRMHLGAAERLFMRDLAGRGFEQRRPGEKHFRALAHEHDIIGKSGLICAARRRRAVHDRDHRNAGRGHPRHVGEGAAALHEHFRLQEKIGAGAFDERHIGQLVLQRDRLDAQRLLDAHRMRGAALDAGIIRRDDAAHAGNEADPGNRAAAVHIVGAIILVHAEAAQRR